MKGIELEKFEQNGELVKAVLRMTFESTNTNPGEKLQESLADGRLGNLAVDKDSVEWVDPYGKSMLM